MTALFSSRCQATSGYRRSLPTTSTASWGHLDTRQFPDGETYLRFASNPKARSVAIVCTLADPNEKFLPLVFAATTARELGASKVGLVSAYLAYMRQDGASIQARP